jgi:hypothetical protein
MLRHAIYRARNCVSDRQRGESFAAMKPTCPTSSAKI